MTSKIEINVSSLHRNDPVATIVDVDLVILPFFDYVTNKESFSSECQCVVMNMFSMLNQACQIWMLKPK